VHANYRNPAVLAGVLAIAAIIGWGRVHADSNDATL